MKIYTHAPDPANPGKYLTYEFDGEAFKYSCRYCGGRTEGDNCHNCGAPRPEEKKDEQRTTVRGS